MHRRPLLLFSALSTMTFAQNQPNALAACTADQLSIHTNEKNGCFNGMSHSGSMIVLHNVSAAACTLDPFPKLTVRNTQHYLLHIRLTTQTPFQRTVVQGGRLPKGHGPVALPVALQPGTEAAFALRWVSGDVYDHGVCVDPGYLIVTSSSARKEVALPGHVCGPDAAHISMEVTRLSTDPAAEPPATKAPDQST